MSKNINKISQLVEYVSRTSEEGLSIHKLQEVVPNEGQTAQVKPEDQIKGDIPLYSNTSDRNVKDVYMVQVEEDLVYLNFVPSKLSISDRELSKVKDVEFEYFAEDEELLEGAEPEFSLEDGIFFRRVEDKKPKEQYQYYIMEDGVPKKIPNYKTLEVMLAERNQTYDGVMVIEGNQFSELPAPESGQDKSSNWDSNMEQKSNAERYAELSKQASSADDAVEEVKDAIKDQLDAIEDQQDDNGGSD